MENDNRIPSIDINLRVVAVSKKEAKKLSKKMDARENVWDVLFNHYVQTQLKKKD